MVDFVPALALAALVLKIIDFLRYLRAGDWNGVGTQLAVWGAGVVALFIAAQTQFADRIPIGDLNLGHLGAWDIIFAGLTVGSTASTIKDIGYKALDNNNTAKIPTLFNAPGDGRGAG